MTPNDFLTDDVAQCICGHPWPCKRDVDVMSDCGHERTVLGIHNGEGQLLDGATCHACGKTWPSIEAMEAELDQ